MRGKDIEDFYKNSKRLLRYASRPGRDELFQTGKIVLITFAILGGLAYAIRLIFTAVLQLGGA